MLVFTIAYKKRGGEYDAPPARFALLAYYGVVIASVTVFMVSCNFHRVGLSISMCYLFGDHDRRPHTAVWIPWRYVF